MAKKTEPKENGPAYSKRIGSVRLAVFENTHEGRVYHNITVSRRYRDGDDWKDTNSMNGVSDLAALKEAINLVVAWSSHREDEIEASNEE